MNKKAYVSIIIVLIVLVLITGSYTTLYFKFLALVDEGIFFIRFTYSVISASGCCVAGNSSNNLLIKQLLCTEAFLYHARYPFSVYIPFRFSKDRFIIPALYNVQNSIPTIGCFYVLNIGMCICIPTAILKCQRIIRTCFFIAFFANIPYPPIVFHLRI